MFAERKGEHRPRRRAADARQSGNLLKGIREHAAVLVSDLLRGLVQVARPGVVAQSGPQMQHLVDRRMGQIGDGWETRHKALKVGDNRRHLRLLQHHLREPYFVGRFFNLPGQGFAPVFVVPLQHLG